MNRVLFSMGFIFSLLFGSFLASAFNKGDCVFAGDIDLENYKEECEYFNDLAPNNKYFCGYYTCERKESVTITANGTETTTQQELPLTYTNGQCTGTVNGAVQTRTAVTKEEYRTDLYTQIENKCERMREEAQEIAQDQKDTQEQVEEAQKDAQEQAAKAQQDKQRQCQAQHRDFVSERDAIERQVQQTQSQIDRLRDQITNKRTLISGGEQQLTEAIRQLQQNQRNTLQAFEENLERTEIQSRNELRQLETQALIKMNELEQLANEKNSVCSERFNKYDLIRENCYNQALAEVVQQRNSYYQRLYSSEVQYRNASDVFSENLKTVEQRFTGLFYSKRQQCYARDIGETEIVSCTVQSLRNRDEACRGSNAANCPTPEARVIEDDVLLKLSNIESSEKTVQLELDNLYKSLEEFPKNKAEAVELMKQRLQNEEQKFQEEHVSLRERLETERVKLRNEIQTLQEQIQRLMQNDPARHFKERLELALSTCCMPAAATLSPASIQNPISLLSSFGSLKSLNESECSQIRNYANDMKRNQHLFVQPHPVNRAIINNSVATGLR